MQIKQYKNISIKYSGNSEFYNTVIEALNKLPNRLFENSYIIEIKNPIQYEFSAPWYLKNTKGFTQFKKTNLGFYYPVKVCIKNKTEKDMIRSLYHEFGYILDMLNHNDITRESQNAEFQDIAYAEQDMGKIYGLYDTIEENPGEYFAEKFAEYMTNPLELKRTAHLTYEYFTTHFNRENI